MIQLRFIGDVHGKIAEYLRLCSEAEHTIQVGDIGFESEYATFNAALDPTRHRFLPGNHDDYDHLPPHALGDYGTYSVAGLDIFYVRGAFSIDRKYRLFKRNWWPQEELSESEIRKAVELYQQIKPRWVVTHDCPVSISPQLSDFELLRGFGFERGLKTRTQEALQAMFEAHQPERWIFGHYHRDLTLQVGATEFVCLGELSTWDLR